jgi:hypothetical protein
MIIIEEEHTVQYQLMTNDYNRIKLNHNLISLPF